MIGLRSPVFLCDIAWHEIMQLHQISLPSAVVDRMKEDSFGWFYLPFEYYAEVGDIVIVWSSRSVNDFPVHSQSFYAIRQIDDSVAALRTVLNPLHDRILVRVLTLSDSSKS